ARQADPCPRAAGPALTAQPAVRLLLSGNIPNTSLGGRDSSPTMPRLRHKRLAVSCSLLLTDVKARCRNRDLRRWRKAGRDRCTLPLGLKVEVRMRGDRASALHH